MNKQVVLTEKEFEYICALVQQMRIYIKEMKGIHYASIVNSLEVIAKNLGMEV